MPSRNPHCAACPLHTSATTVCIDGDGPTDADILIVGEAPGQEEDSSGVPFVGAAGQTLNNVLAAAGLSRSQARVTNAVRCRPPGNRMPTAAEQTACLGYLLEEINEVQPKVIVLLGTTPLQAVVGRTGIAKERGKLLAPRANVRIDGAAVIATFHPTYYLDKGRDQGILDQMTDDLRMAQRIIRPDTSDNAEKALLYDYTTDDLSAALSRLDEASVVAVDLEWTGGTTMHWPWRRGAECYSLAVTGRTQGKLLSVAIAWPPPPTAKPVIQKFFDRHPVVAHNAQADLIWLQHLGFRVKLAGDTMLLAQLLDEGRSLSLEALATTIAGVQPGWKIPPRTKRPDTEADWIDLLTYNSNDTEATLKLAECLHDQVRQRPPEERKHIITFYTTISLPSVPVFVDVAHAGVGLDTELLDTAIANSLAQSERLGEEFANLIGNSSPQAPMITASEADSVANSPQQAVDILQAVFGLPVLSSAKDALEPFKTEPPVKLIHALRAERKLRGTYLEPWRKLADECVDGRLHSVYRLTGARTGRTSAELEMGGSLQVAPRGDKIRSLIRADEGNVIVAADYSQLELRISAWFANDRAMIQLYNQGEDLHKATAAFIMAHDKFGLSVAEFWPRRQEFYPLVTKEMRQAAKGVNFGFVYGMGADKFQLYASMQYNVVVSREEAEAMRNGFFELYADLLPWHERCGTEWRRLGYTVTPLGYYRRHVEDERKAINGPVQGTGSHLGVLAMTGVREEMRRRRLPAAGFKSARLIGFVHDSIMIECREDVADEACAILKDKMEHLPLHKFGIDSLPIPLEADVKVGERWAS